MLSVVSEVKGNRREMYAALSRSAILDAAKQLFVERGFEATSVDDIARAAQLSKGAVYHHFQDKQQVFAEVYVACETEMLMRVAAELIKPELGLWERVQIAARMVLRIHIDDPQTRALFPQAPRVLGPERTRELDAQVALPTIRGLLEGMAELGELRPVNPDTAAQMIFRLLMDGAMAITVAAEPEVAARDIEAVMLGMLEGLRVAPAR